MSNRPNGTHQRRARSSASTLRLLSVAPDLADFLTPEERQQAGQIGVPALRVAGKVQISELLAEFNAFAALVVDGMLLRQTRIGQEPSLRIFGPGELVGTGSAPSSVLMVQSDCRAVEVTQLAMIGIEFLTGAHRWPRLVAGLQARMADGAERVALQLAISQLPRVHDRILAMLWLLAESWGRVTSAGTSLSLSLTHEALGALIGARRPTVTLAIRDLTERGALVHQDRRWLLLEPPPAPPGNDREIEAPEIISNQRSPWLAEPPRRRLGEPAYERLRDMLARLREDQGRNAEQHRRIMRESAQACEHSIDIRRRIRSSPGPLSPS